MVMVNVLCAVIILTNAVGVKIKTALTIQPIRRVKGNQMTKIKHLCFDLDGTLVKSAKTIYNTTIKTLNELNIAHNIPEDEFNIMIGQHFHDIFNHFGTDVPDFEHFIKVYKNNYFDFIGDSELYDGVRETFSILKNNDYKISLLTTKAQDQAEKIITHFNLDKYFDLLMGRRDGIPHKPSPEPLIMLCNQLDITTSETLMVGDTELDVLCGKNAGAKTCAATFGYRDVEILKSFNPDYLINSLPELVSIINESS
jgi:phosphoglycolate phosphatase/pyrophosphatase PpaX